MTYKDIKKPARYPSNAHHRWNCSKYLVAASTASLTFSGFVPLPTLVAPLPPAAPPTTPATDFVHSLADSPFLLAPYTLLER